MYIPAFKEQLDGTYVFCPRCAIGWGLIIAAVILIFIAWKAIHK